MKLPISSVMMDLVGTEITEQEKVMVKHPLVGGIILFTRNFANSEQLAKLTSDVRAAANKPLLIAVDHEGGRVQRFRSDGFTKLPAMGQLMEKGYSEQDVRDLGWLMASECLAHGIDLSFAPVLDLERGSDVVGDRAFSNDVNQTIELATAWCAGMKEAGMSCVGKHFPGHGSTKEDTHVAAPKDERSLAEVMENDGEVFAKMIAKDRLDAIMPAHINFPKVDDSPVGYSKVWLQNILKGELQFEGVLFSDDLSMVGAGANLTYVEKAQLALSAGCDMVLICNDQQAVQQVLEQAKVAEQGESSKGINLCANTHISLSQLQATSRWQRARQLTEQD